ncbi:MAG: YcjX family protein [Pirellulaceae bacterium]|nr:YcjX family protein [Pirellulaceae bacterium]
MVIGMTRAGKTTLICAMIDHWLNHPNGDRLHFRDGDRLICHWKHPVSEGRRHFEASRVRFCDGRWPEKSLKPMNYQLNWRFASQKKVIGLKFRRSFQTIEIADIPGERMADIEMFVCKSMREWSQQVVHKFRTNFITRQYFGEFDQLLSQSADVDGQAAWFASLEAAYRRFIAKLISKNHPLVTPSSLLIDRNGEYVPKSARGSVEQLTAWLENEAHLGLSTDEKLFPLPEALLNTDFGQSMEKTYHAYVKKVARPSLSDLVSAEDVIITVDVAAILQEGPSWKNFTDYFLGKVADTLKPSGPILHALKKAWNWISYLGTAGYHKPRTVQRVFLVSTQSDRVHDRYQDSLARLVDSLKNHGLKTLINSGNVHVEAFPVSAVLSTVCDESTMQYRHKDMNGIQDVVIPACEIPIEFPDDWASTAYKFPIAATKMPRNEAIPSVQRNLDKLSQSLLQ